MTTARFIRYQLVDDGAIVRVVMDRPRTRNAQNRGLLVELGEAFERAEADDQVRVVILSGDGPSFSAGHDLGSAESIAEREPGPGQHPSYTCRGGTRPGLEPKWLQEWHYYFANTWCCDLIVAAEDTVFADVVGTRLGMCGVEYFAHPWEFGPRLAKELLLTGDSLDAQTAAQLHMVSKVFPSAELADGTLALARRIAQLPTMTALLIKDSVNRSVDAMGFNSALETAFGLHQLNHAQWTYLSGGRTAVGTSEFGLLPWKGGPPVQAKTT
jgi:enoyl-CoA hydratase